MDTHNMPVEEDQLAQQQAQQHDEAPTQSLVTRERAFSNRLSPGSLGFYQSALTTMSTATLDAVELLGAQLRHQHRTQFAMQGVQEPVNIDGYEYDDAEGSSSVQGSQNEFGMEDTLHPIRPTRHMYDEMVEFMRELKLGVPDDERLAYLSEDEDEEDEHEATRKDEHEATRKDAAAAGEGAAASAASMTEPNLDLAAGSPGPSQQVALACEIAEVER